MKAQKIDTPTHIIVPPKESAPTNWSPTRRPNKSVADFLLKEGGQQHIVDHTARNVDIIYGGAGKISSIIPEQFVWDILP